MSALPSTTHWSKRDPELKLEMVSIYTKMEEVDAMLTFCQRGRHIEDTPGYYSLHDMEYCPFERSLIFRCAREAKLYCPPEGTDDYRVFQTTLPEFKIFFSGHLIVTQNALVGNMRKAAIAQGVPTMTEEEILYWLQVHWRHPEAVVVSRQNVVAVSAISRMARANQAVRHFKNQSLGIADNEADINRISAAMQGAQVRNPLKL